MRPFLAIVLLTACSAPLVQPTIAESRRVVIAAPGEVEMVVFDREFAALPRDVQRLWPAFEQRIVEGWGEDPDHNTAAITRWVREVFVPFVERWRDERERFSDAVHTLFYARPEDRLFTLVVNAVDLDAFVTRLATLPIPHEIQRFAQARAEYLRIFRESASPFATLARRSYQVCVRTAPLCNSPALRQWGAVCARRLAALEQRYPEATAPVSTTP